MFKRSYAEIDSRKAENFKIFLKDNAKNKDFWKKNGTDAFREINKEEIERLFAEKR